MISVIVPIYNVEKFLEACVESILNSTYTDFELILVDDGSTDRSGIICDDYQNRDPRVKVIHQPNTGVSAARNAGLKESRGDYISFVDSDDLVHPDTLSLLLNAITGGDYDMSMACNLRVSIEESKHCIDGQSSINKNDEPRIFSQEEYMAALFTDTQGMYQVVWNKLYKRPLIFSQDNEFIEFKHIPAEDTEWSIRVGLCVEKVILVPVVSYFYVMRDESLTHDKIKKRLNPAVIGGMNTLYECLSLLPKDKPQYRALSLKDLYDKMKLYSYRAHGTPYEDEVRSSCKNILKNTVKEYWQLPISTREKLRESVYCWWPWSFRTLINVGEQMAKCKAGKN